MTDHKAEAINHISPEYTDPRNPPNAAGQAAQVHATLYLAEQQRIANLIVVAGWVMSSTVGEVGVDLDNLRTGIAGEVWEGLGLS